MLATSATAAANVSGTAITYDTTDLPTPGNDPITKKRIPLYTRISTFSQISSIGPPHPLRNGKQLAAHRPRLLSNTPSFRATISRWRAHLAARHHVPEVIT